MTILQAGYPKSGNYWLYRIIRCAIESTGATYKTVIGNRPLTGSTFGLTTSFPEQANVDVLDIDSSGIRRRVGFGLNEKVVDLDQFLAGSSHVWTHSPLLSKCLDEFRSFDRIVYIVRDPRDVIVSMSHFAFTPYILSEDPHGEADPAQYRKHKAADLARDWARHVLSFLRHRSQVSMHLVFFECLKEDFDSEVTGLLEFLSIIATRERVDEIRERTTLASMQTSAPNHVRSGKAGEWTETLAENEASAVIGIAGPVMRTIGYQGRVGLETGSPSATAELPHEPEPLSEQFVSEASKSLQRSLMQIADYALKFLFGRRPLKAKIRVLANRLGRSGETLWKIR